MSIILKPEPSGSRNASQIFMLEPYNFYHCEARTFRKPKRLPDFHAGTLQCLSFLSQNLQEAETPPRFSCWNLTMSIILKPEPPGSRNASQIFMLEPYKALQCLSFLSQNLQEAETPPRFSCWNLTMSIILKPEPSGSRLADCTPLWNDFAKNHNPKDRMKHPTVQCIHPEPSVISPMESGIQTWAKPWIQGVALQVWIEWQLPTGNWRGWHFQRSIVTLRSNKKEVSKYLKIVATDNQPKYD